MEAQRIRTFQISYSLLRNKNEDKEVYEGGVCSLDGPCLERDIKSHEEKEKDKPIALVVVDTKKV